MESMPAFSKTCSDGEKSWPLLSMCLLVFSFCLGNVSRGSVFVHLSRHLSAVVFVSWHICVEGVALAF